MQEEAVPESLKNILLVMASGGFLVPPSDNSEHSQLWEETGKRLERFLPGMFGELFPEPVSSEATEDAKKLKTIVAAPEESNVEIKAMK